MAGKTEKPKTAASRKAPAKKPLARPRRKTGPKLTAIEKVLRDRKIVELRVTRPSLTWDEIGFHERLSEKEKVTGHAASGIYRQWCQLDLTHVVKQDPLEVFVDMLAFFQSQRTRLCDLADSVPENNANAEIGARKEAVSVATKELALRQSSGLMPHDLGTLHVDVDMRYVSKYIIELFYRIKREELTADDAIAAYMDMLRKQLPSTAEAVNGRH